MNYSFDYDNTLIRYKYIYDEDGNITDAVYDRPHQENINLLRELASKGHRIYIVTSRIKGLSFDASIDNSPKPEYFVHTFDLPVESVIYTQARSKLSYLVELGVCKHWDDCPEQCREIRDSGLLEVHEVDAPNAINSFLREKYIKLITENKSEVFNE